MLSLPQLFIISRDGRYVINIMVNKGSAHISLTRASSLLSQGDASVERAHEKMLLIFQFVETKDNKSTFA